MLRLLLQAGLGFATFDVGRRIGRLKRMAVFLAVAGLIGLLGLGALTAAAVIALEPKLGALYAALSVGGGLVVLAALVGWIGTIERKPKAPPPLIDRLRSEVGAAGSALSSARAARATRAAARRAEAGVEDFVEEDVPPSPGSKRKRALNIVLFATLAGVVLGRRL